MRFGFNPRRPLNNRLLRDPLSGRTVVIAPGRARRPGAFMGAIEEPTPEELDACPFCEGREDRTPPEVDSISDDPEREPDTPGWRVRVVPNLYPALERQEVVIHSPRHVRTFAELDDDQLGLVAAVWTSRFGGWAEAEGFPYVHAMINEGRFAGASLPHSHSQLVWLREPPPAVVEEREGHCAVCELLYRDDLQVGTRNQKVAVVNPVGRVPYEVLIAGRSHDPTALGVSLADALALLRDAIGRLRALEGPVPWNAWLHQGSHWHLEVVPRLTVFAGLELGAGIYVNVVTPEDAADQLRNAL
jgi:UDPglucose--hexose-1-phosphate uridylyltransferase